MEGQATDDILLDTGCSRTMVCTDLMLPSSVSGALVLIRCAHGEAVSYPYPEMRGQRELTIVAVCTFAYTSG